MTSSESTTPLIEVVSEKSESSATTKVRESKMLVTPEKPMHPLLWNIMFVTGAVLYSSYSIFVNLSKEGNKIPFSTGSMWLNIEIFKFMLSFSFFLPEIREKGCQFPTFRYAFPFSIPAILYCINNNLSAFMQLEMDPASYQMFCNFKILSTAVLYRLIIKKPISSIQWVALVMLMTAGMCNSYGSFVKSGGTASEVHITALGLMMLSCYVTISGFSGVYTEYVLKKRYETSLHYQNMLLYAFGIILNGATFFTQAYQSQDENSFNLFHGYSIWTWLLIVTQSFTGLIISAVMKHSSNISKLFLYGGAMLVTTVGSVLIFNMHLNLYFLTSFIIVIAAMYLYFKS